MHQIRVSLSVRGFVPTAAHIHAGGVGFSGSVLVTLPVGSFYGFVIKDDASNTLINQLLAGTTYLNVHSAQFPAGNCCLPRSRVSLFFGLQTSPLLCFRFSLSPGEIRGQIVFPHQGVAFLSGAQLNPPVASSATGVGMVSYNASGTVDNVMVSLTAYVPGTGVTAFLMTFGACMCVPASRQFPVCLCVFLFPRGYPSLPVFPRAYHVRLCILCMCMHVYAHVLTAALVGPGCKRVVGAVVFPAVTAWLHSAGVGTDCCL